MVSKTYRISTKKPARFDGSRNSVKHPRIPKNASRQSLLSAKDAVYRAAWLDCSPSDESSLQSHKDLFDLILYVPSTIFQLNRDGSSWVEPVLS